MSATLKIEIQTVDVDGKPTGTAIATSETIECAAVTHDGFFQFVFLTPITIPDLDATYAIVLVEEGGTGTSTVGWLAATTDDPYADGEKLINDGGWIKKENEDFFFKVFYDAPTTTTSHSHSVTFSPEKARQMFVSASNTMELDMRFMVSFCIDGTGTMVWADPTNERQAHAYLFAQELMVRCPLSYIDVWVFDDTIYEGTAQGPTQNRPDYAAAFGAIFSIGTTSRLWAATEQAVGNLEPSSAVDAIVRDQDVNRVLQLMEDMDRIDYDELALIDPTYDPDSGFAGISAHSILVDYLVQQYADTMGRVGLVMSEGLDTTNDVTPAEIATLANGVMGEQMTPVNFFAFGDNHQDEGMAEVAQATGGNVFHVADVASRVEAAFNILLNDSERTIFQGSYTDTIEFDETTYLDSLLLTATVPSTSALTLEIALSYDGISYGAWQSLVINSSNSLKKFVKGFKYRIKAWMGNTYGGNYLDVVGPYPEEITLEGYRDEHYPSPTITALTYTTTSPAIRYLFTEPKAGGDISEYILVPTEGLPETSQINWGIVRGDSTDFADAEQIIIGRKGVLPDRKREIYFIPEVRRVGLKTEVADTTRNLFVVKENDGTVATWEDADEVTVYSNGTPLNPATTRFGLAGALGYVLFEIARSPSETIVVDIITPQQARIRRGEICSSQDYRNYYAKNGLWPWDARVTVRVDDSIVRDGYVASPDQGLISFHRELDAGRTVTVEIEHSSQYRIGMEILDYNEDNLLPEPDFGFMFQKAPATDTLYYAGQTLPPEIVGGVTLSPPSPSTTSRLVVNYVFHQEQGNSEMDSKIEWFRKKLTEGAFSHYADYDGRNVMRASDVPADNPTGPFQDHDQWYVVVTPKDINNEGTPVQSNIVTIGGTAPPYVTGATVTNATGDDALTRVSGNLKSQVQALVASYTYVDPNLVGDQTLSDLSVVQWYRNGDGAARYTGKTLPVDRVASGQVWYYVVTPYDGISYGDPITSEDVAVTAENETGV